MILRCKILDNLTIFVISHPTYHWHLQKLWFISPKFFLYAIFFLFFHKTFFEIFFFFLDNSHYNSKKTKHVKPIIEFQYKYKTWNKIQIFEIKWMWSTQFISKFHLKIQIFESNAQTIKLVLLMYYVKIEIKIEITKAWQSIVSS